jgi:hypothetical protein
MIDLIWLRGLDLNQRPLGYEPNELPGCSTPHFDINNAATKGSSAQPCVRLDEATLWDIT